MNLDDWLSVGAQDLADLADLAQLADGTENALDELMQRGLEWLARLAPYDLAVVFELVAGELRPRAARGPLLRAEVRQHRLRLDDFPSIRAAIEERRCRVFTEEDHAFGDGDPFDGVMDFPPGHACLVMPLVTGCEVFGVMSLDRSECVAYPRGVVELAEVFGRLLGLSIQCIRQGQRLARLNLASEERVAALDRRIGGAPAGPGVFFESENARVRELAREAMLVAMTSSTVLLVGETGTGKERLARFIHERSERQKRPFVPVNCAALPTGTLESELFGHERGAFTGAQRARPGLFRAADGGTLFLDEVGELPLDLQGKLLRVLQEREILPVGADRSVKVNVRVIAATNMDLRQAVAAGRFREDLYYRLSVFPLHLPPLRERLEDLPLLHRALLSEIASRLGRPAPRLSDAAIEALRGLDYPGNIRELSNLLERGAIRARAGVIERADLGLDTPAPSRPGGARAAAQGDAVGVPAEEELVTLAEHERRYIERVLRATGGRIYGAGGAAEILGLPPTTLQSRMKRLDVRREPDRPE